MQRKIVLFEMNEVPFKILDQFIRWAPDSVMASRLPGCRQYGTLTQDVSSLTPWMTWPGVHRGVNDEQHRVTEFGQDLSEIDRAYPPLWEFLRKNGVRVGMFGSLHSYPMPKDLEGYDFYIPDTFAAGSECFPKKVSVFQDFNLSMARESARNVQRGVPWAKALQVLANAPELGLKLNTLASVAGQLMSERAEKWKVVRRRTFQSVLAFDIFMKQLERTKPGFTTFFTNHVASSMHRFWAASFPEEYDEMGFSDEWIRTYRAEIDWTMRQADRMFARLVEFADKNPDFQVWVATSMGQAATKAEEVATQLYIRDLTKFMRAIGFEPEDWSLRPAMLPQHNLAVTPGLETKFHEAMSGFAIDGKPVGFRRREAGFFSIDMGHTGIDESKHVATLHGRKMSFDSLGLFNQEIQDKSGSSAYHIPQGCLFIYDPKDRAVKADRPTIGNLDIAPAIIQNFGIKPPEYMQRPVALAAG